MELKYDSFSSNEIIKRKEKLEIEINKTLEKIEDLKENITNKIPKEILNCKSEIENINREKSKKLKETEEKELEKNKVKKSFNFIKEIYENKMEDNKFNEFLNLYNKELLPFFNSINFVYDSINIYKELENIIKNIELISKFKELKRKQMISISGGFSTGKSSFLNSLFDDNLVKLQVGIDPVTSIPTYLINGENELIGINKYGAKVNIELDYYKKLNHKGEAPKNLRDKLPYIVFKTKILSGKYSNICFVDTPGYNPGSRDQDYNVSLNILKEVDSIIWLVKNVIEQTDLDFLKEKEIENKDKYFVLTHADIMTSEQRKDIINHLKETLDENNIKYKGITTYSSIDKKEYEKDGISLFTYLNQKNQEIKNDIITEFKSIFKKYKRAIDNEITNINEINKDILDLNNKIEYIEISYLETGSNISDEKLDNVIKYLKYNVDRNKKNKEELIEKYIKLEEFETQMVLLAENIISDYVIKKEYKKEKKEFFYEEKLFHIGENLENLENLEDVFLYYSYFDKKYIIKGKGKINSEKLRRALYIVGLTDCITYDENLCEKEIENKNKLVIEAKNLELPNDCSLLFMRLEGEIEVIGELDTSNVENMQGMFYDSPYIDINVSNWNVSNVKYFTGMFLGARSFKPNIIKWNINVENEKDLKNMIEHTKLSEELINKNIIYENFDIFKIPANSVYYNILEKFEDNNEEYEKLQNQKSYNTLKQCVDLLKIILKDSNIF